MFLTLLAKKKQKPELTKQNQASLYSLKGPAVSTVKPIMV